MLINPAREQAIRNYLAEHRRIYGRDPSYRQIAAAVHASLSSVAAYMLRINEGGGALPVPREHRHRLQRGQRYRVLLKDGGRLYLDIDMRGWPSGILDASELISPVQEITGCAPETDEAIDHDHY